MQARSSVHLGNAGEHLVMAHLLGQGLCPRKRTFSNTISMSAKCHKRTSSRAFARGQREA